MTLMVMSLSLVSCKKETPDGTGQSNGFNKNDSIINVTITKQVISGNQPEYEYYITGYNYNASGEQVFFEDNLPVSFSHNRYYPIQINPFVYQVIDGFAQTVTSENSNLTYSITIKTNNPNDLPIVLYGPNSYGGVDGEINEIYFNQD